MTTITKVFGITAALVVGLMTANAAQAQSFQHIDRLASQLERQVGDLHEEVHAHFRPTSRYAHLDQDVAQMERLVGHIHDLVHRGGSVRHMRQDVAELDRLYHHVEDLTEYLARRREIDFRTYSHLRQELNRIGDTLHHLADDLDELARPVHPFPRPMNVIPSYYRPF